LASCLLVDTINILLFKNLQIAIGQEVAYVRRRACAKEPGVARPGALPRRVGGRQDVAVRAVTRVSGSVMSTADTREQGIVTALSSEMFFLILNVFVYKLL